MENINASTFEFLFSTMQIYDQLGNGASNIVAAFNNKGLKARSTFKDQCLSDLNLLAYIL